MIFSGSDADHTYPPYVTVQNLLGTQLHHPQTVRQLLWMSTDDYLQITLNYCQSAHIRSYHMLLL